MSFTHLLLSAGYILNIILILFILFFEEKDSASRFTWLLLVSFIPVAGIILYVLFSGNFFTRTKRMLSAKQKANAYFESVLDRQQGDLDNLIRAECIDDYGSLIRMNLLYGRSPVLVNNTVGIFTSGEEKFRALFAELKKARDSIHLCYFIINNDETGRELISILCERARSGVRVRLLYDHFGSLFTSRALFAPLRKAGGQVSRFFPVTIMNPFSINYRNHRKIVIIDGRTGYFGGMNVGDEYANRNGARSYYWRDTHVRVTGEAVQMLQKQFLVDWYTSTVRDSGMTEERALRYFYPAEGGDESAGTSAMRPGTETGGVMMQIVAAGPDDSRNDEIRDAMIHMISLARKSVYIESPYFTPDNAFFTILKIAALSGIDVSIILPGTWDKWYCRLAAMPYIRELLSCGVKFWYYPGFIHSKMVVIDGLIATIGSTNMDTRSFSLHFELNAFFYTQAFGSRCSEIFLEDRRISATADPDWFSHVSFLRRGLWNFFKLFAPLM